MQCMAHVQHDRYKLTLHLGLHGALAVQWMRQTLNTARMRSQCLSIVYACSLYAKNITVIFRQILYIRWTNHAGIFTGDLYSMVLKNVADFNYCMFLRITKGYLNHLYPANNFQRSNVEVQSLQDQTWIHKNTSSVVQLSLSSIY